MVVVYCSFCLRERGSRLAGDGAWWVMSLADEHSQSTQVPPQYRLFHMYGRVCADEGQVLAPMASLTVCSGTTRPGILKGCKRVAPPALHTSRLQLDELLQAAVDCFLCEKVEPARCVRIAHCTV